MDRFTIELIGPDKTKINAELLESAYVYDLVRIDVNVEPGTINFLRRNKVFYLKVLKPATIDTQLFGEKSKYDDNWVRLKQRIKKCNGCEKLNWKFITFIAKPLTNLEVLQELNKEDIIVEE